MLKKTLAAVGIAGFLVLGASAPAFAYYPPEVDCTATPASIAPGATSTIVCTGFTEAVAYFGVEAPAGTLSSIVLASGGGADIVEKPVSDGSATATFTGPAVTASTTYTVLVAQGDEDGKFVEDVGEVVVTVAPASTGGGGLPPTGGEVPAAAIWLGVGAIGIGGIAVAAAVARRRAHNSR